MKVFFKKIYWAVAGITLFPVVALGAAESCTTLYCNPLSSSDLSTLVENLAQYAAQIGATIAVVMIVYSGYKFVAAQGNDKKLEDAKKTFTYTVIGTAILLGAWVIATAVQELITGLQ